MNPGVVSLPSPRRRGMCAIAGLVAIAALAGCTTTPPQPPAPPPVPSGPPATHPLTANQPEFLTLPNIAPNATPVRIGILLPFTNSAPGVRALADAMMKSAELALFDANRADVILMSADEGNTPEDAAAAAGKLLDQGAEVIVGPLFAQSVSAVAPIAHDHAVPVIAFSSDRTVGGDGVYLLSFQPENEVKRIVSYAVSQGHANFAALIPQTPYGEHVSKVFADDVTAAGGKVVDVERFEPTPDGVSAPSKAVAATGADAILIAQGGTLLRAIAPTLATDGVDETKVKLLGTGVWDDESITKEPAVSGGWFAAPQKDDDAAFAAKYKNVYGQAPPRLAPLAYDAVSLVETLATGPAYHRFTAQALTDPNGFAGVDGIFRFEPDGSAERGLAVMEVTPDGFTVVSPAPKTFQAQGS